MSETVPGGDSFLFPDLLTFQLSPSSDSSLAAEGLQVGDWTSGDEPEPPQ